MGQQRINLPGYPHECNLTEDDLNGLQSPGDKIQHTVRGKGKTHIATRTYQKHSASEINRDW
jgi:hypothetical protein